MPRRRDRTDGSRGRGPFKERYASWQERWQAGRDLRERVPREKHAGWTAPRNRRDPIELLLELERSRLPELLPIRHTRMLTSPFAFLRGAASVMASDLAGTPATGVRVQACGDCHLLNFGVFATPEREVIFDINDFDETLPAPWEWDLKRLAASITVAARYVGQGRRDAARAAESAVRSYRKWMANYSRIRAIEIWYDHIDFEQLVGALPDPKLKKQFLARFSKERARSVTEHDFPKMVIHRSESPRIRDNPPLIYHLPRNDHKAFHEELTYAHRQYLQSLPPHYRVIIERYKLFDVAMKVVGVGSVGTLCGIALLMASDNDSLFIQIKEADASALEPYAGASEYSCHGQRVVVGQRFMQAASDILLGWTRGKRGIRDFYLRQLRDMKMSITIETMKAVDLNAYAKVCGRVLARAHARSADPAIISGYMGNSTVFDEAVAAFALDYSDQTDRDHEKFAEAVRNHRIKT
jgi:uncharacterized protein (DUF2252 family)